MLVQQFSVSITGIPKLYTMKDIKIIKSVGKSPQQYPEGDDFFDDEYA